MSLYTTGELAKKCNVSVRTIQYYDERGILVPTDLTEGGRRLFSEEDVATLETICFLRDLDISIKDIAEILESEESKKVIELLLDEQEKNIQADVKKKTKQLENIKGIRSSLASFKDGSQKTIHDIFIDYGGKRKAKENVQKNADHSNSVRNCRNCYFCDWYIKRNLVAIFCGHGSDSYLCSNYVWLLVQAGRVSLSGMPYQISAKEIRSILWKSYAKDTKANLPYLQEENLEFGSI